MTKDRRRKKMEQGEMEVEGQKVEGRERKRGMRKVITTGGGRKKRYKIRTAG